MGVNQAAATFYSLSPLTRLDVGAIVRGLYEEKRMDEGFNMTQPTIDGDSNNICHMVARKKPSKSEAVAEFYKKWALCGLAVVPVVDGDIRPTCKQASNERIASREKV